MRQYITDYIGLPHIFDIAFTVEQQDYAFMCIYVKQGKEMIALRKLEAINGCPIGTRLVIKDKY